jgi:hypothetical protein
MSGFDAHRTKHAFMRVNRDRCMCAKVRDLHQCLHCIAQPYSKSVEAANAEDLQPICTARTMLKGGSPEDQSYLISDSGVFGRQWVLSGCTPRRSDRTLRCLRGIRVQRVQSRSFSRPVFYKGKAARVRRPVGGLRFTRLRLVFVSMQRSANGRSN